MTQSAAVGTADGAVDQLGVAAAEKLLLHSNIALAFAVTYLFGVVGVILLFKLLPGMLGVNLKEEVRQLEQTMGGDAGSQGTNLFSWTKQVGLRAYVATNPKVVGNTVMVVERLLPPRVAVCHVKRAETLLEARQDLCIEAQDILVVAGKQQMLIPAAAVIGPETDVASVVEVLGESLDVCVLNSAVVGKTLGELGREQAGHGLFLTKITRQGHELPILMNTVVNKCDILHLVGLKETVDRVADFLGYPQRATAVTDLVMLGLGCMLGMLVGLIVVPVAGVPITLGTGGGVLAAGLACGWLRSKHPTFGQIPDGAQWLLNDLGLSFFVACVGLGAGKAAWQAMQTSGLAIFLAGIVVALVPVVVGGFFGRYVLKMNPVLLLGGLTGARVLAQATKALAEDTQSQTLAIGFAAPYAFANIFLTILGSVIVNVM